MTKEEALLKNGIMGYELGGKSREAAVFNAMDEYKAAAICKAFEAYREKRQEFLNRSKELGHDFGADATLEIDLIDQFLKEYENEN